MIAGCIYCELYERARLLGAAAAAPPTAAAAAPPPPPPAAPRRGDLGRAAGSGERLRFLGEAAAPPPPAACPAAAGGGALNTRFGVGECGRPLRLLFLRWLVAMPLHILHALFRLSCLHRPLPPQNRQSPFIFPCGHIWLPPQSPHRPFLFPCGHSWQRDGGRVKSVLLWVQTKRFTRMRRRPS